MFNFIDIDPNEIDIQDIAHSLSMQCRYTGHSKVFYSVAEHSVAVADLLLKEYRDEDLALAGLLHDAVEAYISDLASPLKQLLPEYKAIEDALQEAIEHRFKVTMTDPRIKMADIQMLSQEASQLLPSKGETWDWQYWGGRPKLVEPVVGLPPVLAKELFLKYYNKLENKPELILVA